MTLKKGEFIELEYEGRIKATGEVFDKTEKPKVVCVGERWILEGIDRAVLEKDIGQEFELELKPEEAFGQRNPSMMKVTALNKFKDFRPVPGIQVNVDGVLATVKSVSSGRVILDFNHPLSGKTLHYKIKIVKKVDDIGEKSRAVVQILLPDADLKVHEKTITIKTKNQMPEPLSNELKKQIIKFVPEAKDFEFKFEHEKPAKDEAKAEKEESKEQKPVEEKK
ncbi:MAG: peptidylprolyl isomerase [archaeon]